MATLRVGTLTPTAMRLGTVTVTAAYLGTTQVWPLVGAGVVGTLTGVGKRPTAVINGTFTPLPVTGTITASANRATAVINATFTAAGAASGTITAASNRATAVINATHTATGTITGVANRATAVINGTHTAPAVTGTITASSKRSTAVINGTVPVSGFAKYRSFDGVDDIITVTGGNLVGAGSVPHTVVFVVKNISNTGDAEVIAADGFDPLDIFYVVAGTTIGYYDGVTFVNGPSWFSGQNWCLFAFRTVAGSSSIWSRSVYSGSAWPTPTHTTTGVTLSSRPWPSGVITMGNTGGLAYDCVLFARFNTNLTDAQINAMTAGVTAVQSTPGITNLWHLGQTTPADLVGTSTLDSMTGTTLSAGFSPFPN